MKSYQSKEMDPRKFNTYVPVIDIVNDKYNTPKYKYDIYTCEDCANRHKCPQDIKAYHNHESKLSVIHTAPSWCMGTSGYNKFVANWDELLED